MDFTRPVPEYFFRGRIERLYQAIGADHESLTAETVLTEEQRGALRADLE